MAAAKNETKTLTNRLDKYLPILKWLPHYDRSWLRADVIAGLTLWGLVVPEAMAYAGVANLPPQAGLYTLLAALMIYAMLGTSRHLVQQFQINISIHHNRYQQQFRPPFYPFCIST